jgi:hypothetical protein
MVWPSPPPLQWLCQRPAWPTVRGAEPITGRSERTSEQQDAVHPTAGTPRRSEPQHPCAPRSPPNRRTWPGLRLSWTSARKEPLPPALGPLPGLTSRLRLSFPKGDPTKRRTTIPLVLLTICAITGGLLTARLVQPTRAATLVVQVGRGLASQTIPALSPDQTTTVRRAIATSSSVHHLLRGASYRIADIGVWSSPTGAVVGGEAALLLAHPASLQGAWPTVAYPCPAVAATGYVPEWYRAHRVNVTVLTILVDLGARRIVDISPDPQARLVGTLHGGQAPRTPACTQP